MNIIKQHSLYTKPVYAISNVEDGRFFSGGADKVVCTWDANTGEQLPLSLKTDATIFCIHHVNQLLFIGTTVGHVHIIDLVQKQEVKNLKLANKEIFKLAATEDKKQLYIGDGAGFMHVLDIEHLRIVRKLPLFDNAAVRAIHVSAAHILVAGTSKEIIQLEAENLNQVSYYKTPDSVYSLALDPTKPVFYSGGKDGRIHAWKLSTTNATAPLLSIDAHNFGIYDLKISKEHIYSCSRDKSVKQWNLSDLSFIWKSHTLQGHSRSVNALETAKNKLISCGDDGKLIIWQ